MPDRLRILQVLEPSGGGSGRHFIDLSRGLQADGHDVTAVYSPLRAEDRFIAELRDAGLSNVLELEMRRAVGPWDIAAVRRLRDVIRRHGPFDIVHGHSSKAGALARLALPGGHVPKVYTPHAFRTMDPTLSFKGRVIYGSVERLLGRFFSDRIICVSPDEMKHARALGLPERLLRLVVNGVATPESGEREGLRPRFGATEDTVIYGFVGRLSPQKAPERLIEAFTRITATVPRAIVVMVGFGELEQTLRQRIDETGLSSRVQIVADIPGAEAIHAFDVLVMPSRYEAMSYVMLEAAAAGLPLILTDVGGAGTVLADGVNGLLVPNTDDVTALTDAMLALADDTTRKSFSENAMTRSTHYGLDAMVANTLAVYREVLRDKNSRRHRAAV